MPGSRVDHRRIPRIDRHRLDLVNLHALLGADQLPVLATVNRAIHTFKRPRRKYLRIRWRPRQRPHRLSLQVRNLAPASSLISALEEAPARLPKFKGAGQNVLRVGTIHLDVVKHKIIPLAHKRQALPRAAPILRLIDPAVRRSKIQVSRVFRISRKRARASSIRPNRDPLHCHCPRSMKSKQETKEPQQRSHSKETRRPNHRHRPLQT